MKKLTTEEGKKRHEIRINAMKRVFDSADGKLLLEFMRMAVNPDTASSTAMLARGGPFDTHMTAYLDGRKSVYFEVLSAVEMAAEDVATVPVVEAEDKEFEKAGGFFQCILRRLVSWLTQTHRNQ